jgi:ATP-binding cassette subfamily B protein
VNDPARNRPGAKVRRLFRLMWEAWRAVPLPAAALALRTLLLAATAPALPWATGRLVDAIAAARGPRAFETLVPWVLAIVAIRLLGSALSLAGGWLETFVREAQMSHVLGRVLDKVTRVPLERYEVPGFHDSLARTAGDFAGYQMHDLFWRSVYLLQGVLAMIGLAWVAGRGDVWTPVVILGTGLATMFVPWQIGVESYALQRAMSQETRLLQYMARLLTERASAKEVRLFGLAPYLLDRWQAHSDGLRRRVLTHNNRNRVKLSAIEMLPVAGFGLGVMLALFRARAGLVGVGMTVATIYAALSLQEQWQGVSGRFSEVWGWYLRAVGDLTSFLDEPETPSSQGRPLPGPQAIEVQDLTFRYPSAEAPALEGVTFRLEPGEKVALVGENGAGKSTLVHLLLGMYRPTAGTIRLGGCDVSALDPGALWERTGAVFQDFTRYHLTVRDNVGYGHVARLGDDDAIALAATAGGAADFVDQLPQRYETVLGPTFGGRDLSSGQWQRVATARGLMRRGTDLLVLDEPTAALDPKAEEEVYRRFAEQAGGRTAILISHRMGFARLADRILVLKDGHLVEQGTHEALMRLGGEYQHLFATQARWYA